MSLYSVEFVGISVYICRKQKKIVMFLKNLCARAECVESFWILYIHSQDMGVPGKTSLSAGSKSPWDGLQCNKAFACFSVCLVI